MLALAFSLAVFAFWTVLGRAVIALAYPRFGVLRSWLMAPAIGLSVVLLSLMVFNQAGWGISAFATPVTVVLGIAAVAGLAWRTPTTTWRPLAPFAMALVISLLWTGWPAFEFGFKWVSYANDDMANYCLAAQRFMDGGFYHVPTKADLIGQDYASYYFFMHVADMMRFGAEHLVAWGASIGHVAATQAFMPVILALGLVQIASVGALVLHLGRWRNRALVTVWLLAVSPLFMLGTLYQLIAQVGGVALLMTTVGLLLRPWVVPRRRTLVRYAILPAITASALCIFYPEVTPFAAMSFVAFTAVWVLRHRTKPAGLIALAAYTLVGVVVLLRHNLISYVSILVVQSGGAMNSANLLLSLFPYFMLPTGFSNLLGWMPIAFDFPEPVVSLTIAIGMITVAAALLRTVRDSWRMTPAALLFALEFGLAVRLFVAANDFGLYKLAMWMQPVLCASIAGILLWVCRRRVGVALACVAIYAVSAAPTALYYTKASQGVKAGGLTELRLASQLGLQPDLPPKKDVQITSTIENVVAAKFASSELRGYPVSFPSRDYFYPTTRWDYEHPVWTVRLQPHFAEMAQAYPLIAWRNGELIKNGLLWRTQFTQPVETRPADYFVSLDPQLSLFNKFGVTVPPPHRGVFVIEPAASVHNRVLFVHSWLGNHYYLGDRRRIGFFQQEADVFAPGRQFNAIGRFLLLRIENASPKVYLRISATRTLITGRTAWNPASIVRGTSDLPLGAVGNGAFNLFVGPIAPETFDGAHYVALDFQEIPRQLFDYRPGLKGLYHRRVLLDYRRILGWARDISAVSEDEYAKLQPPRAISRFPADLATADTLEFSGAYEDGWLSSQARFVLGDAQQGDSLRLRGAVPQLAGTPLGTGTVRVTINGTTVAELPMPCGEFNWLVPIPSPASRTTVDLQFTATGNLPGRDQRPVGALLQFLGLENHAGSFVCNYNATSDARPAATGIDLDGWMRQSASMVLPASDRPIEFAMRVESPGWGPRTASGSLRVKVAATGRTEEVPVSPGASAEVRLRLPASASPQTIELGGPAEFALPAPDSRQRSLRILEVRFGPGAAGST
jgi:hypothetical protein